MGQILKGETFTNGEQVQDYRLNQLVDSAQLLVGAISEQPAMTANTVEASDQTLINDGGVLKKTTFGDVLNSNLPATNTTVTTSVVNGATNKDVVVTPNDGVVVSGKVFTSADGITTTVTSAGHGLTTGQIVTITASVSSYSGQFIITVTGVDTFTYVIPAQTPAVTAASGTCSYTKEGAVIINGHARVNENFYLSGNTTTIGTLTTRGTLNVVGALQFNGTVGYVLTEIVEETVALFTATSVANNFVVMFTSSSYTKPSNEIWCVEIIGNLRYNITSYVCYKLKRTSGSVDLIGGNDVDHNPSPADKVAPLCLNAIENAGTSFTSTYTFEMAYPLSGYTLGVGQTFVFVAMPATKFRIYKYKAV